MLGLARVPGWPRQKLAIEIKKCRKCFIHLARLRTSCLRLRGGRTHEGDCCRAAYNVRSVPLRRLQCSCRVSPPPFPLRSPLRLTTQWYSTGISDECQQARRNSFRAAVSPTLSAQFLSDTFPVAPMWRKLTRPQSHWALGSLPT